MKQSVMLFVFTIVFTIIFTTIIISSLVYDQNAYALRQVAGQITIQITPGETQLIEWGLASDNSNDITTIHLRAEGDGAEFISFVDDSINIEPSKTIFIPVTVSIPDDYPGGITLSPKLYATEFGESGGATVMNIQMLKIPVIIIALNDDDTLHVNWDEINQQEIESTPTISDDGIQQQSIITSDEKPTGFSIVSDDKEPEAKGGGCLIATATYGTELAPQVQMLRELRDDVILSTQSGASFMNFFNSIYYSFSPYIADLQRESPIFREAVKITITPLLYTLSILSHTDINSEYEMVGYGISIIALNVSLYIGVPVIITRKLIRYKNNNVSS